MATQLLVINSRNRVVRLFILSGLASGHSSSQASKNLSDRPGRQCALQYQPQKTALSSPTQLADSPQIAGATMHI